MSAKRISPINIIAALPMRSLKILLVLSLLSTRLLHGIEYNSLDDLRAQFNKDTGENKVENFINFGSNEMVIAIRTAPGNKNKVYYVLKDGRVMVGNAGSNKTSQFYKAPASYGVSEQGAPEMGFLGFEFHPNFNINPNQPGYDDFFIFYTKLEGTGYQAPRFNVLSRVNRRNNQEIILFKQSDSMANHNGGDLRFGPDGYLYVSLGDEGGSNDDQFNGQLVNKDFFAGIIRIDVDKKSGILPTNHPALAQKNYHIPADNPLVQSWRNGGSKANSKLRLEFYAIGLRNPWRTSFHPSTGELWVGDVGQYAKEEVNIIKKGGNYGWPTKEGTLTGPRNVPAPAGFKTLSNPHHQYDSGPGGNGNRGAIIGGFTYTGAMFPELVGSYIFGDYVHRKIWALKPDKSKEQIANAVSPVAFGQDPSDGAILICTPDGHVKKLTSSSGSGTLQFPEKLSGMKAFTNLQTLAPAANVIPYEPNVAFWSDNAIKTRWISVPKGKKITYRKDDPWSFPDGTILIKHFELDLNRDNPGKNRTRIETRFLVITSSGAHGLAYKWDSNQLNATLIRETNNDADTLSERTINYNIWEDGASRQQKWEIPTRSQCLQCHTDTAGYALSFNTRQLNKTQPVPSGGTKNFLSYLGSSGLLNQTVSPGSLPKFYKADDSSASMEDRVRSYLAVNCVSCHQPGGNTRAQWDARPEIHLSNTNIINGPVIENYGISARRIVVPNSPNLSVMLGHINPSGKSDGYTRMPPLGSNVLDQSAINLLTTWINGDGPTDPDPDPNAKPTAPKNVSAKFSSGSSQISVTWDANPTGEGVTSYLVYHHNAQTGRYGKAIGSSKTPSFTHSNIDTSKTNYYKIKASKPGGLRSVFSAPALATVGGGENPNPGGTKPTPPTGVQAAFANNSNTVNLAWNANPSEQDIFRYFVYHNNTAGGAYGKAIGTTSATNYSHNNVDTSKSNYYKLKASQRQADGSQIKSGFSQPVIAVVGTLALSASESISEEYYASGAQSLFDSETVAFQSYLSFDAGADSVQISFIDISGEGVFGYWVEYSDNLENWTRAGALGAPIYKAAVSNPATNEIKASIPIKHEDHTYKFARIVLAP